VALNVESGEARYLDDLRADGLPDAGAVAPATWVSSGFLLYAAPTTGGGFTGTSGASAPVLFEVAPGRIDSHRVGDVAPVWAPIVRGDGVLLTLARGENDVLILRPVDPTGHALAEQRLGVQVSGAFAARWDLSHQQLLIVRGALAKASRFCCFDSRPTNRRWRPALPHRRQTDECNSTRTCRACLRAAAFARPASVAIVASIAAAAPLLAQTDGQPATDGGGPSFPSIPNPLAGLASMLSPDNLGKLIQDTAALTRTDSATRVGR
jgi:hypothetical protein